MRKKEGKIKEKMIAAVAREEELKELAKKSIESAKKLNTLLKCAKDPLIKIKTVFPFDFFPDELIVDMGKVSVAYHHFFSNTFDVYRSIPIEDIGDIYVSSAIIFATIEITDKNIANNKIKVGFLRVGDAIKARRIIEGLVTAKRQGIDLVSLSDMKNLSKEMEDLGRMSEGAS